MSDHGDHAVAEHDLTDLYVFRKPGDPAKTILVMNMNPDVGPGVSPRARPFDPDASYDFMIDADGDAVADSAFRVTFSGDGAGHQAATVRRVTGGDVAGSGGGGTPILQDAPVSPATEPRITVQGGLAFFAGRRSDPFFEDLVGRRNNFQWTGKDFLAGHNVSAIVLEVPNSALGSRPPVGIWARVRVPHGQGQFLQADRVGRPFANVVFNSGDKEARNMFNQSQPAEDRGLFLDGFASYLQGTGRYSVDEATAVATTLLPDILTYDWTTSSRFPNGRTLTDDVSDWMWALLTKGTAPNDGIGPHTDLTSDFPYLGPPHMHASAEWQGGSGTGPAPPSASHQPMKTGLSTG
jgi:Domain of unknown function (DUF4331)